VWLAVLFVTTVALHHMSPVAEERFLRARSTNLRELSSHPVRVLIASAMWIEGGHWVPYAVLYSVFHARVERWLGTVRWLAVCVLAHVVATLVSEGVLLWAIRAGVAPVSSVDAVDVGVSYALAGVMGVLVFRIRGAVWRYGYLGAVLVVYGAPLVVGRTFTDVGHAVGLLTGLVCGPVAAGRVRRTRNPKETAAVGSD
jgi:hypothetical protein